MTSIDPPAPEPVAPAPPPRRFLRSVDDRVLGGVAGGLGRTFGVDAIIFRIALAALIFAGGIGLLIYGAALLLVPADDGTGNPAPRPGGWRTPATVGGGALLLLAAVATLGSGDLGIGDWVFPAAVVVGVGYLAVRVWGEDGLRGSALRRLLVAGAIGLAVLIGAGVAFWGSAWATAAGGGVAVASVVLALGVALVVASFRGDRRARWLALPALLIALPAAVVSAADINLDGGVGQRTYRPAGADRLPAGYRLGAGEMVVDLRGLDWRNARRVALKVDLGVGHAVVLVPYSVCVGARSDIGAGYANVFGRDAGGVDLVHDVPRQPAAGSPGLTLDVHMGMGAFEVLHRYDHDGRNRADNQVGLGIDRTPAARRTDALAADRACSGAAS